MLDLLVQPGVWVTVVALTAAAVVFGRSRREPSWSIAMTAVGASAFILGLRWASDLGEEAFAATAIATGGMALWSEASARMRVRAEGRPAENRA